MRRITFLVTAIESVGGIESFNRTFIKALDSISVAKHWENTVLSLLDRQPQRLAAPYSISSSTDVRGFSGNRAAFAASAIKHSWSSELIVLGHVNFAGLALGMNGCRKHLIVHGIDVWKRLPAMQRLGVTMMDRILSVSEYTRNEMIRHNGLSAEKFEIFPNSLDPLYRCKDNLASRSQLRLPQGRMLLSVSRLNYADAYKHIDNVIAALPEIIKSTPDCFYVVVGDGPDRPRLESLSRENGLNDKVLFAGRVNDEELPSYFEACDLFVLPSRKEGFGIVFLEAMRHGKACVAARAGAVPEVIEDGRTGALVDPGDDSQLASEITSLLHNPDLRKKYGEAGRERLEREFSFDSFRSRLENELSRALEV